MFNIKNIHIAIASERKYDAEILRWLCKTIGKSIGMKIRLNETNIYSNTTKISRKDIVNIKKIFDGKKIRKTTILIVITDRDGEKNTDKILRKELEKNKSIFPYLVVTPVENIERWLLYDPYAVNKVLDNPKNLFEQVPNNIVIDSKKTLDNLIGHAKSSGTLKLDEIQTRIEIAKNIRLGQLKAKEFIEFRKELLTEIFKIVDSYKKPEKEIKKIKSIIRENKRMIESFIRLHLPMIESKK